MKHRLPIELFTMIVLLLVTLAPVSSFASEPLEEPSSDPAQEQESEPVEVRDGPPRGAEVDWDRGRPVHPRARVRVAKVIVAEEGGVLPPVQLERALRKFRPQILSCYERFLQQGHEQYEARIKVGFTILETGKTDSPKILETNVENETLHNCVLSKIRRWNIWAPQGGSKAVRVVFELTFKR